MLTKSCTTWLAVALALAALAALAFPGAALAGPTKPTLSTPTIACDYSGESTNFSDIKFTAGSTGAPAGFSIQWETQADFTTFGWAADSDCPLDIDGNPTCPPLVLQGLVLREREHEQVHPDGWPAGRGQDWRSAGRQRRVHVGWLRCAASVAEHLRVPVLRPWEQLLHEKLIYRRPPMLDRPVCGARRLHTDPGLLEESQ